ncbi:MAG: SPFH domain-containing protein [Oscillospiraceae bacterium]|jgi:membrane protease subunit (stomatin/prohibitin family)|nr:SPFH domain-containing protein [Oscillospiraceae bacterium]
MAIVDVIKYNGGPDVFAWKYPNEQLGTWTQVIVNESQEVVLFKGGQALDVFAAGRHTLSTANIPILNKIVNLPFGGRSPFAAEVWYINKIHSLEIKWGTQSPIQLQDPKYNIFIPVRSFGQFGIQINDSKEFLTKLVGTLPVLDKDSIVKFFRGLYLTKVKDSISSYLIKKGISILEMNAYLVELSEFLKERIAPTMAEYGINLLNFYVKDINVPEDDPAVMKLKDALSKRAEMDIVGYTFVQERSFDTLEGAATNPGSAQAGLMGAGIGLGMGMGVGGTMGGQMGTIAQNINTSEMKKCQSCNAEVDMIARFCPSCGTEIQIIEQPQQIDVTICSECGADFSKNYKFCPSCSNAYNPCYFCGADMKKDVTICPVCEKTVPKPCPKCGILIENENAKFCPECGESFAKKCSGCGIQIDDSHKFCPECGIKTEEDL